jgi:MFS family permease
MVAMAVAMGIGRFVYTPILPGMMEELGLSPFDAGVIASANYVGYLLGAVLAAGSWGRGREYAIAMSGVAASAVWVTAMGLTESLILFAAIRFLAGIASAFVMVFLASLVLTRLAAAGRDDLQVWHFGGVGAGMAISAILTGVLIFFDAGWKAGWLWSGLISMIGFVVVLLLVDRGPVGGARPAPEPRLPQNSALTRVILAYGLFGFGYIITATFLIAIVRQAETGPLFESVVWLAAGLAGLPSVWLWGFFAKRFGAARAFSVGCVVEAVGVAASVSLGGYAGPLLGGVLLGATFIAVTTFGLQLGRQIAPQAPRRAFAMMTAAFGVGQILGPVVAGLIADQTGSFTAPSLLAAAVLMVSGGIVLGTDRKV